MNDFAYLFEFVNDLPVGIARADATGTLPNHYNSYFLEMFGWESSQIDTLEKWFAFAYPDPVYRADVQQRWDAMINDAESQNKPHSYPIIVKVACRNGDVKWCEARYYRKGTFVYGVFTDITTQKEHEHRLEDTLRQLQKSQKVAKLGIWELDLRSNNLSWTEEIFDIFELDKATFQPSYEAFLGVIHPEDRRKVADAYNNSLVTKEKYQITHRLLMPDGRVKWVEEQCDTEFDAEGSALRSIGTVYNITEQKLAEEKYRKEEAFRKKNEKRLEMLLELNKQAPKLSEEELAHAALDIAVEITESKIGYLHTVHDDQNHITLLTWNNEALNHCKTVHDSHYPLESAGIWADAARLKRVVVHNDYETAEGKKGLPQGHFTVVRHMSAPVLDGDSVRMIVGVGNKPEHYTDFDEKLLQMTADDIEKFLMRKRAETDALQRKEALQKQKEEFETIFKLSRDGIAIVDLETNFLDFNDIYMELSGYTREELMQQSCIKLSAPAYVEQARVAVATALEKGYIENFEKMCLRKDGKELIVSMSIALLPDGKRFLVNTKDVSEDYHLREKLKETNETLEKRVEEELEKRERQQKMMLEQSRFALMGEMLSAIAHQWRQPLSSIGLIIQDFADAYEYGELNKSYLDENVTMALGQIRFMSDTINDFSNFFKPNKEKEHFTIQESLKEVNSLIGVQLKSKKITLQLSAGDFEVYGYKRSLSQVFLNIINNAKDAILERQMKFPEHEGVISVEVVDGPFKKVIIEDNGVGIPDEIMDKIFNPYFSSKFAAQGTGIGLYMSRMIIEEHHYGRILAENSPRGARFIIEFNKEPVS